MSRLPINNPTITRLASDILQRFNTELKMHMLNHVGEVLMYVKNRRGQVIEQYAIRVNPEEEPVEPVEVGIKPTIGRIVYYTALNGIIYPAIIQAVYYSDTYSDTLDEKCKCDLIVFFNDGPRILRRLGRGVGTGYWKWPERT